MESVTKQWRNSVPPILSTSHCEFNGTGSCAHAQNHPPGTHSLVYKTNSTFIVSIIIDLRFFAIDHTAFPEAPYKFPPSINNIFTCASYFFFVSNTFFHFHRTLFRGLAGAYVNPGSFSQTLFCAFICLCNNSLIS